MFSHVINLVAASFVGGIFVLIGQWITNHSNEHQSEVDIAPDIAGQLRQSLADNRKLSIENIQYHEKQLKADELNAQLDRERIEAEKRHANEVLQLRQKIESLENEVQSLKIELERKKGEW